MKARRTTGALSVLAAFLVAGLAGTGHAAATVLCESKEEACVGEHWYQAPTTIKAEGSLTLSGGLFTETCSKASLGGETTEETEGEKEPPLDSEGPLIGSFSELTAGGCTPCTKFAAGNLPYKSSLVFSKTVGNGTWTLETSGKGKPRVVLSSCSFGVSCTFGVAKLPLGVTGGNPATLLAEGTAFALEEGSEFLCGGTAKLKASLSLTSPKPAFVGRGRPRTRLCKTEPTTVGTELVCPIIYSGPITGTGTEPTTFNSLSGTAGSITCEETIFKGNYMANGSGTLESLKFQNAGATPCKATLEALPPEPEVEVKLTGLPSNRSLFSRTNVTTPPQGTFLATTGGGGIVIGLEMKVLGENPTTCTYRITSSSTDVTNGTGAGSTTLVSARNFLRTDENPAAGMCPATMDQTNKVALARTGGTVYVGNR